MAMSVQCPICQGDMNANDTNDPIQALCCMHAFHSYCISQVAFHLPQGKHLVCPVCKTEQYATLTQELAALGAQDEEVVDGSASLRVNVAVTLSPTQPRLRSPDQAMDARGESDSEVATMGAPGGNDAGVATMGARGESDAVGGKSEAMVVDEDIDGEDLGDEVCIGGEDLGDDVGFGGGDIEADECSEGGKGEVSTEGACEDDGEVEPLGKGGRAKSKGDGGALGRAKTKVDRGKEGKQKSKRGGGKGECSKSPRPKSKGHGGKGGQPKSKGDGGKGGRPKSKGDGGQGGQANSKGDGGKGSRSKTQGSGGEEKAAYEYMQGQHWLPAA